MSEVPLYTYTCIHTTQGHKWKFQNATFRFAVLNESHTLLRRGYRSTSLIRNSLPLGTYMYSRPMPRALWWSQGGGAVSDERDTPVRVHGHAHSHLGCFRQHVCVTGVQGSGFGVWGLGFRITRGHAAFLAPTGEPGM
jgi:hypothetical protein